MRKYFTTRKEANKERGRRLKLDPFSGIHVWKMPKGSRRAGYYAVCSEIEYLNTY